MVRSLAARRRGFTLLELIIVLAVLAALAALVVPVLGWVRDQSKFATAAAGAAEALNNLETFKAATGKYPNRFDSLVQTGGTAFTKVYGVEGAGTFPYGAVVDSSSSSAYYYLSNGAGMTEVMMHTPAPTPTPSSYDPNASTETVAATPVASASFVTIDPATTTANYEAKMRRIVRAAFPNQTGTGNNVVIPTGHQLIALGIGSRVATNGTTMVSAPVHQGAQPGYYSRFIAIFDVSAGPTARGKVQLKMVVDSEFEILAKNVANYGGSGPSDDQGVYTPPTPPTP